LRLLLGKRKLEGNYARIENSCVLEGKKNKVAVRIPGKKREVALYRGKKEGGLSGFVRKARFFGFH